MTKELEFKPSSGWSRLPIALLLIVGAPIGFVLRKVSITLRQPPLEFSVTRFL
jgi:hypothetical protein